MQAAKDANQEGLEALKSLRSEVFEDDDDALAPAMGRPVEEIKAWFEGWETIDEDAEMKIRGLLRERTG